MINRSLTDILDKTFHEAARVADRVAALESTHHLRNSGVELLRALQCSLGEVIELLEPETRKTGVGDPDSAADRTD